MNEQEYLSVSEAAKKAAIPAETVRRYIRKHGRFLDTKKNGRAYLVAAKSINLIKQIRAFYEAGKDSEQVENELIRKGASVTLDADKQNENIGEMIAALHDRLQGIEERLSSQEEFNKQLIERLDKRDQELTQALRISSDKNLSKAKEKKESFLKRLFKKR